MKFFVPLLIVLALVVSSLWSEKFAEASTALDREPIIPQSRRTEFVLSNDATETGRSSVVLVGETSSAPEIADTGSAEVQFVGRDRRDRLQLVVSTSGGLVLAQLNADADQLELADLQAAEVVVELRTQFGIVLKRTEGVVVPAQTTRFSMDWPEPLEGERFGSLSGNLRVPPMAEEAGLLTRLTLHMHALLDTPEQQRSAVPDPQLSVSRLLQLSADTYAWTFKDLPVGSYLLRFVPLGYSREVRIRAQGAPQFIEIDPGDLGHCLIAFVDSGGAGLHPEQVSMVPLNGSRTPLAILLRSVTNPDLYDLVGVPGPYRISIQDSVFGQRDFTYQLEAGWADVQFELVPLLVAELDLVATRASLRRECFRIEGLGDGQVITLGLRWRSDRPAQPVLRIAVNQPGTYRCTYEHEGLQSELQIELKDPLQSMRWDLP